MCTLKHYPILNLASLNPLNQIHKSLFAVHSGFTVESSAALTVLLASKLGIPISSTHCIVGSVVFVGWTFGDGKKVDWSLFRSIIFAWLVTLPVAGAVSAFSMWLFMMFA